VTVIEWLTVTFGFVGFCIIPKQDIIGNNTTWLDFMSKLKFPFFIIILVFLAACGQQDAIPTPTEGVFTPPTPEPTQDPAALPAQELLLEQQLEEIRPTPTPVCSNSLWFLQDVTIPDGSVVIPGERLDKRWEVRNNGTCNWGAGYQVKLIAGPGMGIPVRQALYPALSTTDVVIRMVFIAPVEPGRYRSAWQAYGPQDNPFGDPFFIDVIVPETEPESTGE
jgi:hypothetical protein